MARYIAEMDGTRTEGSPVLRFRKMHGLGNDFVIIDQRSDPVALTRDIVRAIGDRHLGVGFDQLAEIYPSDAVDADLIFWNADGSLSAACGNATRCIADLLMQDGRDAVSLRTERGILPCRRLGKRSVQVDMGPPSLDWDQIPLARAIDTLHLPLDGAPSACSMGNPHCSFFVDDVDSVNLNILGPATEHDPLFPERTNVQVVQVLARDRARVRVWERGVGPTLASGSSSCAVLVNAVRRGLMDRSATLVLDGGEINITWTDDDHVLMAGPVAYVFDGAFDPSFVP